MPVENPLNPEELEAKAAESILGDPSLRDELTDDEAKPLIDWGVEQAAALARNAAQSTVSAPEADAYADAVDASLGDLRKLMKRINRLVKHRAQGDREGVEKDLARIGKFSARLFGEAAPAVADTRQQDFLNGLDAMSNETVVRELLGMFAPPPGEPPQLEAPPAPEQLQAPPQRDRLAAPPARDLLSGPEPPDLLPDEGEETTQ